VVAANDRVIPTQLEEAEAKQLNAVTITLPTSHVAMIAARQGRWPTSLLGQLGRPDNRRSGGIQFGLINFEYGTP
jgi:hypothetical protein